jgi:hypothetical protein
MCYVYFDWFGHWYTTCCCHFHFHFLCFLEVKCPVELLTGSLQNLWWAWKIYMPLYFKRIFILGHTVIRRFCSHKSALLIWQTWQHSWHHAKDNLPLLTRFICSNLIRASQTVMYTLKLMLCWKLLLFCISQVTVHVKGKTECYECQPKPVPKSYPVCTITSTPSKVPSVTFS